MSQNEWCDHCYTKTEVTLMSWLNDNLICARCKEKEMNRLLCEEVKKKEYENVENYIQSDLYKPEAQPFANFNVEQQNFIIKRNLKLMKQYIISWHETKEEWNSFLLEKGKKLELDELTYRIIKFENVVLDDGVISTNFGKTINALTKKSEENESISNKLNQTRETIAILNNLTDQGLSYYLKMKNGKVKKEALLFRYTTIDSKYGEKLKLMKSNTNDKQIGKKIRELELLHLYTGDKSLEKYKELLIEFIKSKESDFSFLETCMSYEIFLIEKELNEKLIELISFESIRQMALKREDLLFTLTGSPERMN
jgi:hypothetical protein